MLRRLVGDPHHFLTEDFGQTPRFIAAADTDGFSDLLSLDDVDRLVTSSALRSPSFRLVREGRTLERSRVTRRARIGSRSVDDLVDLDAVHREFGAGATIVLQGLHRSFEPVAHVCRSLEVSLSHPVQANAYLTPPSAQGLNLHADPHDVFAVQTYGVKRWVVHPPGDASPWDLQLQPGDVLYLPAGTRHAAQTIDRPSLHLTIGVRTVRWADVLRPLIEDALDDPTFAASLPAGWADEPDGLADAARTRLGELVDALSKLDPADALERRASSARAQRPASPRGLIRDTLEAAAITDTTVLRRRDGITARLEQHPDRATLVLPDRQVRMPGAVGPVVERLLTSASFAPKELDDLIDEPSRVVLCQRLVREGLLAIASPHRDGW